MGRIIAADHETVIIQYEETGMQIVGRKRASAFMYTMRKRGGTEEAFQGCLEDLSNISIVKDELQTPLLSLSLSLSHSWTV